MNTRLGTILTIWLLSLMIAAPAAAREDVRLSIFTENYGRYNYSLNGRDFEHWEEEIGGSSTELVKAILQEAGFDYRMRLRTWRVGYGRALERPYHGVFSAARTEQRENLFHWVGPIADYNWILFRYQGSTVAFNSIEDLRGLRVGGYDNSATTLYLESLGISVSKLPDDRLNAQRLAQGQIDVWIASDVNAYDLADEAGYPDIEPALVVRTVDMYLAMNPNTPQFVLDRLDQAFTTVTSR